MSRNVGTRTRCFPRLGGSITGLSVTDSCRWLDGDETSMRFQIPESLVNIAHFSKKHGPSAGDAEAVRCLGRRASGSPLLTNPGDIGSTGDRLFLMSGPGQTRQFGRRPVTCGLRGSTDIVRPARLVHEATVDGNASRQR